MYSLTHTRWSFTLRRSKPSIRLFCNDAGCALVKFNAIQITSIDGVLDLLIARLRLISSSSISWVESSKCI
jgi:hypothetical protein